MRLLLATIGCLLAFAGVAAAAATNDPLRPRQWGMDMIEADAAHNVTTGVGATVAVIDTGVQASHEDLAGRLLPGKDFVDGDDNPDDGNGHGTHVTGIIAADANNGIGVMGGAPGAKVLPVRVLDNSGSGSSADVAKGIDYAISQKVQVINLSLGGVPIVSDDPVFDAALGRALDAGIVVVAAAGNDALPVCEQPSGNGRLLCVAAVDKRGMRSVYSSFGGARGISAPGGAAVLPTPGEDILSTVPPNTYGEMAGTSQAAPHVAAVAALLASKGLRGQAVVDRLLATATDAGPAGPDDIYGAGIVNARAAVTGLPAAGPAGSGSARAGSVYVARNQNSHTVLRRGYVAARCRPTKAGRCSARIVRSGRTLAQGSAGAGAGKSKTFRIRLTSRGRRTLRHTHRANATARFALPGSPTRVKRAVTFRR
jgi:subtilisin family serine protease